jgi:hypothetical protein
MKFREHRGSLTESMQTVVELANRDELVSHLNRMFENSGPVKPEPIKPDEVEIKFYLFDDRIGWNTYLVFVRGFGPVGFSDSET